MRRIILLFAIMLIFITGCQDANNAPVQVSKEEEPLAANTVKVEPEASIPKEQELVRSLDDLYRSYHTLKIQKYGESTVYDVVKPLEYTFADMLSKVRRIDMESPEGEKLSREFDYEHYDYRLKFEGAVDMLFTLKGNVCHFEGEKQLYFLWGDSKPLWESLAFDNGNRSADIIKDKIRVMVNCYQEDVDGDEKSENIELAYERSKSEDFRGDLILSINGSKTIVMKSEEWATEPYHTIGAMPDIWFQQEQNGKSKAVLVIYSWATNGIGSTGVINAYKYANKNIAGIEVKEAKRIVGYNGKDTVSVSFPALRRTTDIKIDIKAISDLPGEKESLKQLMEMKNTDAHPLWYIVGDYNGDGKTELCSVALFRWQPIASCRLYTYYTFENGKLRPVQAFVTPPYNDDKITYLREVILDLIHSNGYLTIGDKGIMDESFKPGYDYTPEETKRTIDELQHDKILKLMGDRLYINY